ncbi:MAG TPA: DUF4355 domain-containing protein [Acidimicrobiales bacterium]|nr:DUF4355 domain-containing protein [Acidimicrobiales bacterium]
MDTFAVLPTLDPTRRSWVWPDGTVLPVVAGAQTDPAAGSGDTSSSNSSSDGSTAAGGSGATAGGTHASTGAGATVAGDGAGAGADGDSGDGGDRRDEPRVTMTQAELDALIERRISRARRSWEQEQREAREREQMSEVERARAEREEARRDAEQARREALQARVEVAAERHALRAGVDPARVARFLRVAELGDLDDLTNDGQPDEDAIARAVAAAVKDWPEFIRTNGPARNGASGADMNGQPGRSQARTLEEAVTARLAG